jgi:hypothetical protein
VILGVILKIETEILHPARSRSTCVAKRCLLPDDFSRENTLKPALPFEIVAKKITSVDAAK